MREGTCQGQAATLAVSRLLRDSGADWRKTRWETLQSGVKGKGLCDLLSVYIILNIHLTARREDAKTRRTSLAGQSHRFLILNFRGPRRS